MQDAGYNQIQRRVDPSRDFTRLADELMMASPTVGSVVTEEDVGCLHQRFDELAEGVVGPMYHEDYVRLAVVLGLKYGLRFQDL